jgi:hypothetical protein
VPCLRAAVELLPGATGLAQGSSQRALTAPPRDQGATQASRSPPRLAQGRGVELLGILPRLAQGSWATWRKVLWARGHTSAPCQRAARWSMCRAHTVLAQGIRARALTLPPTLLGSDPSGLATLLRCDVMHDSMAIPQKHVLSAVMSSMSMARPNTVF